MSVFGGLAVDWFDEIKFFDDDTGSKVEVLSDDFYKLFGRMVGRAICLDKH